MLCLEYSPTGKFCNILVYFFLLPLPSCTVLHWFVYNTLLWYIYIYIYIYTYILASYLLEGRFFLCPPCSNTTH
jgi:hypothetical protein